jgi:hypothetical protein
MRRVVVFPEPLGPSRVKNSPCLIDRFRSTTAGMPPNDLWMSRKTTWSLRGFPPAAGTPSACAAIWVCVISAPGPPGVTVSA